MKPLLGRRASFETAPAGPPQDEGILLVSDGCSRPEEARQRRLLGDQRGVAAIEAALVLPLLFLLLAGIMEYSRVLLAQHMIRDIIDEAVRSAVVQDLSDLAITASVEASVDDVPGLGEYDVSVDRSVSALSISVSGDFELVFGDLLPSNVVSFSLASQYPI